jgi:hypothetical protein
MEEENMNKEVPPEDPQKIWQSQSTQDRSMPLEEIHRRAQALQTRVHRNLIVTITTGFVVLVLSAILLTRFRFTSPGSVVAILMVLIVITISRAYKAFWTPDKLPPEATPDACLNFYKRELTAQYRAVALNVPQMLLEITLFAVILRISFVAMFRFDAIRILVPLMLAAVLIGRYWKARKLKRELNELTIFESESS